MKFIIKNKLVSGGKRVAMGTDTEMTEIHFPLLQAF
jgi:hypothetical protein